MFAAATSPVVVVDGEVQRFGLENAVHRLLDATGYPFAAMMLGKSIIDEHHPQFIGLYEGDRSRKYVRERVENADAVLLAGPMLTDFNTGGFSAHIDQGRSIAANHDRLRVRHHYYDRVQVGEFLEGLAKRLTRRDPATLNLQHATQACRHRATETYQANDDQPLKLERFFHRISHFLDRQSTMIVETGSALFAGAEVLMPSGCRFMSQTFFGSIGYTVGATLGAALAAPDRRTCLFVGDGSFQVTAQDVSTMIRYGANPIIFLLNNDGYLVERVISDGPFNDLQQWDYARLPEVFGGGYGCKVRTEGDLEQAPDRGQKPPQRSRVYRDRPRPLGQPRVDDPSRQDNGPQQLPARQHAPVRNNGSDCDIVEREGRGEG